MTLLELLEDKLEAIDELLNATELVLVCCELELTVPAELESATEELASVVAVDDSASELAAVELGATLLAGGLAGAEDLLLPPPPPPPQATRLIIIADRRPC